MITSLDFRRFRGFHEIRLENLTRINIVVGDNGTGKTALLEGLFLLCSNSPQSALGLSAWRGIPNGQFSGSEPYEALWGSLFHNFDLEKPAFLQANGTDGHSRMLEVGRGLAPVHPTLNIENPTTREPLPVAFSWTNDRNHTATITPTVNSGGLSNFIQFVDTPFDAAFISSTMQVSNQEVVQAYSDLSITGENLQVVEALKVHFPDLVAITQELAMGTPQLYAEIKGLKIKQPVSLISSGFTKMLYILTKVISRRNRLLFVDEIENGIYYGKQKGFWDMLRKLADNNGSQVFATTHSLECLKSASRIAAEHPADFSLIRTEKARGYCTAEIFSGDRFHSAIEEGVDPR